MTVRKDYRRMEVSSSLVHLLYREAHLSHDRSGGSGPWVGSSLPNSTWRDYLTSPGQGGGSNDQLVRSGYRVSLGISGDEKPTRIGRPGEARPGVTPSGFAERRGGRRHAARDPKGFLLPRLVSSLTWSVRLLRLPEPRLRLWKSTHTLLFNNEVNAIMSTSLEARLDSIENLLRELLSHKAVKEYYSTADVAERVGRSEYQVREWCRTGRIQAVKKSTGRGRSREWMVSYDELVRYESHGLRPVAQLPA
jgi:hypothetical protein